jgi:hypothetical protein
VTSILSFLKHVLMEICMRWEFSKWGGFLWQTWICMNILKRKIHSIFLCKIPKKIKYTSASADVLSGRKKLPITDLRVHLRNHRSADVFLWLVFYCINIIVPLRIATELMKEEIPRSCMNNLLRYAHIRTIYDYLQIEQEDLGNFYWGSGTPMIRLHALLKPI